MFCDHAGEPDQLVPFHVQTVLDGHWLADA
jgi:hypothetical protein